MRSIENKNIEKRQIETINRKLFVQFNDEFNKLNERSTDMSSLCWKSENIREDIQTKRIIYFEKFESNLLTLLKVSREHLKFP